MTQIGPNQQALARMAGQIADFFKAYPEDQAVEGIAAHINKFWSGRMRSEFLAVFSANDAELPPLLRRALPHIRPAKR